MKEAYKKGLWKPNVNLSSQKGKENDPVAGAFQRSRFFWKWIVTGILNTCSSDEIMSLPQQYLKQVEKILLQTDRQGQLGTEMFSKDPVSEIVKRDVAQYMEQCCHDGFLNKGEIPDLEALLVFFMRKCCLLSARKAVTLSKRSTPSKVPCWISATSFKKFDRHSKKNPKANPT
jgi:hypothetical protein